MAKQKTKPIRWLTTEQIEKAATNLKKALRMSFLHWKQVAQATEKQLRRAVANGRLSLHSGYCSLCHLYQGDGAVDANDDFAENCKKCILSNHYSSQDQCCKEWYECDQYWDSDEGTTDYKKFHIAAGKMRDKLARILKAIES